MIQGRQVRVFRAYGTMGELDQGCTQGAIALPGPPRPADAGTFIVARGVPPAARVGACGRERLVWGAADAGAAR
jgi:hypothetical protein